MNLICRRILVVTFFISAGIAGKAQLLIREVNDAQALAQKLVGDGVLISNATLTRSSIIATGFFNNLGGTNIGMDSGIVLSNGGVLSDFSNGRYGVNGDGISEASTILADGQLGLPGDADLANELGLTVNDLNDAVVLEFDVTPLGDSIKFNYIMSSEEYSINTVCVYNDAFALFISGPGITGNVNLARIPGTNTPVSIKNVNDITIAGCVSNPNFYVDNSTNKYFTHNGHTTLFTAASAVQPCQVYHLKMVVADQDDDAWDTAIFIEAKSLSSSGVKIDNKTPLRDGVPYLAEGCTTGGFNVVRARKLPVPAAINLTFSGTAGNGTDVTLIPASFIIPANDSVVFVPISAIADNLPETVEKIKIFVSAVAGDCGSANIFSDSIEVEIWDYDTLSIIPKDSAGYCSNTPVTLTASGGYTSYVWDNDATLSANNIPDPSALPVTERASYYCTAALGSCQARDSVLLKLKRLRFLSKQDVICKGAATGSITVAGDWPWARPAAFELNNNYQSDSTFANLPAGLHNIKMKDAAGCIDSVPVTIVQLFPDLIIDTIVMVQAGCTPTGLGSITVTAVGGSGTYLYSSNGIDFQNSATINLPAATYPVTIKDGNQCTASRDFILTALSNLSTEAGSDIFICEGDTGRLNAVSTGSIFSWFPPTILPTELSTAANPVITTKYYLTARLGVCTKTDSVTVFVYPAPVPVAGRDSSVCFGGNIQLQGSGGVEYAWRPADMLNDADIPDPNTSALINPVNKFYLSVKDIHGCTSLKNDTVIIKARPPAKLNAGNDTILAINQPIPLRAIDVNNTGFTSYSWAPSYGLSNPLINNPLASLDKEIIYTVTATTPQNCTGIDSIKIKVYKGPEIYVPTGFTPNGDGTNDIMKPIAIGIKTFNYFTIYNRWGQVVFTSSNAAAGWDGTFKGAPQDTGTYVWIAKAVSYRGEIIQRKGSFVMIR